MDWGSFLPAFLTAVASLVGVYLANRKSAALLEYRMKQLEDKVNKHNQLVERTYKLEGQMTEVQHEIADLKGRV